MTFASTDVNVLVYKYMVEAGFMHTSYTFANESQVTKAFPDMSSVPPNALIRFVQKGMQYTEMEANLKEDRHAVDEDYQLVAAADAIMNDAKDLRELVQTQRADKQEDSDDQEDRRDSSERGTPTVRVQPAEQKAAKGLRRGRGRGVPPQSHSPARQSQLDQPHPAQPASDRHMPEHKQAATHADNQTPGNAAALRDMPNGHSQHAQPAAWPLNALKPVFPPQITVLDTHSRETRVCSWCPTAAVLASGLGDPEALLWSGDAGCSDTQMPTVLAHSGGEADKSSVVECMDWQSDGTMLATGSMDGWIRVWNKSGQLLQTLKGHGSAVTCLKFSRHTNLLLSGSFDKAAIVWQADTGVQMQRITAHTGSVCCVAWKDDHQFATASADHVIHLHAGDQACTATLKGDATDLTQLTWSPNGDHLVSCCEGGTLLVWSPSQQTLLHTLTDHTADVHAMAWSPATVPGRQHTLATASQDQTVRLWDLVSGTCQHKISLASKVRSVDFHPSGHLLVSGCDDGEICLWSIPDGNKLYSSTLSGGIASAAWNSSGDTVAAACRNKLVHLIFMELQ
ncbi:TPA: Transducin (beta)-like 1 X-linked receptor 1 [Trebouxia sp. C0005]